MNFIHNMEIEQGDLSEKKLYTGLTSEDIKRKTDEGLINGDPDIKTKSYGRIIRDNVLSLFNLINTILVLCIFYVGSYKNALFFLVIICNTVIGIVQEIRAKHTIEKLSLLSAPKAQVLRDGEMSEIPASGIVLGEIMRLENGDQICADSVVLDGQCEVNESLLTGENDPIHKKRGDHLLSGSFLVSGRVTAEAEHVGTDNYVNKITVGAKYYKKSESVIMRSVKNIVRVVGIAIIPVAALLIWSNFFKVDQAFETAMVKTVAALSSMIPGGLVLLVSIVLAVSVVRLATQKALVQNMYSVENLARVDTLCMDKTGTITEGVMSVDDIIPVTDGMETGEVYDLISDYIKATDDNNATISAVRSFFNVKEEDIKDDRQRHTEQIDIIPFSSDKKWGAAWFGKNKCTYIMGAADVIDKDVAARYEDMIRGHAQRAKRVLLFAKTDDMPDDGKITGGVQALALIILEDSIRSGVKETLDYFKNEDVELKIISGDDPVTVATVAEKAGVGKASRYIDASTLESYEDILSVVDEYSIFGRVSPYQKIDIIKALKEKGHTVAMVGDGANDVLALKESDCSIAMQSGSDAARNVSDMVLLSSDFFTFRLILAEGRKSINNLQRSASLYLTKTTYAFIMALFFIFATEVVYPFENVQLTLISTLSIGIPSFILALEPNNNRVKDHFLYNVFKIALPSGVFMFLNILISVLYSDGVLNASHDQVATIATYTALIFGLIIVLNVSGKLNLWKGAMMAVLVVMAVLAITNFPGLFSLVHIDVAMWRLIIILNAILFIIYTVVFRLITRTRST